MNSKELLWEILCKPKDIPLRLVYADLLEEEGDVDRAYFIRLSCQYWEDREYNLESRHLINAKDWARNRGTTARAVYKERPYRYLMKTKTPAQKLLNKKHVVELCYTSNEACWAEALFSAVPHIHREWRQGFIYKVQMTWRQFKARHAPLFQTHPIEKVVISDAESGIVAGRDNDIRWLDFVGPPTYANETFVLTGASFDAAQRALSDYCVQQGRMAAGLPPLV